MIPQKPDKLLKWMQTNLKYDKYPNATRDIFEVLKDKRGNCVDFAYFVGVVLTCKGGFIVRYPFALVQTNSSRDPHVWVQFWDPKLNQWIDLDATSKKHNIGDHYEIIKPYEILPSLERFGAKVGGCKKWTKILK